MRSIGELCRDVIDAMEMAAVERATNEERHGGAEGAKLYAVPVTPGEGGELPAMGIALERDGAVTPRQVYREAVNYRGRMPQRAAIPGKHMLTVLTGGQDQARSRPHKAGPALATCLVLITEDGVRVDHASTPAGLSG